MARIILNLILGSKDAPPAPYVIVNDLLQDERFAECALRKKCPRSFVACFPLIAPSRHILGFYLVVDEEPRQGLSESEIQFGLDMAATVIDHLKSVRIRSKQVRSEQMVRALGSFINGSSR